MNITSIIIQVCVVVMSITIHEYSHALSAYLLGDDTAKKAGRLKLNPISHIDPLGAIMLFVAHIGWAKPVPINPYNFRNMKRDTAITASAGPISNFIMAILSAMIMRGIMTVNGTALIQDPMIFQSLQIAMTFFYYSVFINIALGLFNLIPLPPLDGSKILGGFLSDEMYFRYTAREKQGAMILVLIMAISFIFKIPIFSMIINRPLEIITRLLLGN
jgi:Zn-dependent protease